jgi:serine/threonine protein kinase
VKVGIKKSTGQKFAIKIVDKSSCKGKEDMLETEVKVLKMIQHQNIVRLYQIYEYFDKIYLVMELYCFNLQRVTGGELFDEIMNRGTFKEKDAAKIIFKVLNAINYLHSMGVVHRDLKVICALTKPENLLLSDKSSNPEIKISDFGLSKILTNQELMKTACGTPGYVGNFKFN